MRLFVFVMLFGSFIDAACAQQQQQSLAEQALSTKLFQEINASLACSISALGIQHELDAAKARIKELEAQTSK